MSEGDSMIFLFITVLTAALVMAAAIESLD